MLTIVPSLPVIFAIEHRPVPAPGWPQRCANAVYAGPSLPLLRNPHRS